MLNYKFTYRPMKFCVAKGTYIDQMMIKKDSSKFFIVLRHVMDGQGGYTDDYHIYSTDNIIHGMECRRRKEGDRYYIKLNRREVENLLGREATKF